MQILSAVDMMLPPTQAEVEAAKQADEQTKAPLTNAFLQGTWCTIGGDERSQIVFDADGSMKFCLHDAYYGPYCACHSAGTAQEWLIEWTRATTVEQDRIVLEGEYRTQSEFKRGECQKYGL